MHRTTKVSAWLCLGFVPASVVLAFRLPKAACFTLVTIARIYTVLNQNSEVQTQLDFSGALHILSFALPIIRKKKVEERRCVFMFAVLSF
jgi:hypothetical protein